MEFLERTKYRYLGPSAQNRGVSQPPLESPVGTSLKVIELPRPQDITLNKVDLRDAIEERASIREYSEEYLSMEELSWLIWSTQGVKQVLGGSVTIRTVPSAGARHALDTYLLVNRVGSLEPGLYRYIAMSHQLALVNQEKEIAARIMDACLRQGTVVTSAVTFIWVANFYRMTWRYGERGMRYIYLDAGHVCQNLYLAAGSVGCGVCAIGAFEDDKVNIILNLEGENYFTVYIATLGKRK
jgi:SagB-type dehydrogenase family enzyme